jgi:hypothetical protein
VTEILGHARIAVTIEIYTAAGKARGRAALSKLSVISSSRLCLPVILGET